MAVGLAAVYVMGLAVPMDLKESGLLVSEVVLLALALYALERWW